MLGAQTKSTAQHGTLGEIMVQVQMSSLNSSETLDA
jgi:hypothetical protein